MPEPIPSEPLLRPAEPRPAEPARTATGVAARGRVLPMPVPEPSTRKRMRKQLQISTNQAAGACRKLLHGVATWLERGRIRARYLIDEYPFHVVGTVAITAFALGIVLRIRRTRHE
jgi:hypothetical protein